MKIVTQTIETKLLWPNTGQITGLPENPRFILDERFEKLVASIKQHPEMLHIRECVVYPYGGEYVIIAGNMRHKACIAADILKIPCKILPADTPVATLRAIAIKDNIAFGTNDYDILANSWDETELTDWGMELPNFEPGADEENADEAKSSTIRLSLEFIDTPTYDAVRAKIEKILDKHPGVVLKDNGR